MWQSIVFSRILFISYICFCAWLNPVGLLCSLFYTVYPRLKRSHPVDCRGGMRKATSGIRQYLFGFQGIRFKLLHHVLKFRLRASQVDPGSYVLCTPCVFRWSQTHPHNREWLPYCHSIFGPVDRALALLFIWNKCHIRISYRTIYGARYHHMPVVRITFASWSQYCFSTSSTVVRSSNTTQLANINCGQDSRSHPISQLII